MRIAIIGSGGREHAIAWKLARAVSPDDIFVLPGNGGTANNVCVDINNFDAVRRVCDDLRIDLLVVGPEAPLAAGIVDYFKGTGLKVFGPSREAAKLESSKIRSKEFMERHGVATARHWAFDRVGDAAGVVEELHGDLVIKFDGLAAGKGVYVCDDVLGAGAALKDLAERYGAEAHFLIEERLRGQEISILGFTDGRAIRLLTPSQDHKQLYAGDDGPNTGGMGAFCPVPHCGPEMMEQIMAETVGPTLAGLQAENLDYHGVIYFGLMITAEGPRLLEYNVRLGDPEAEVILPALKSNLLSLMLATVDGSLDDVELEFHPEYFVDVVLASGGYPFEYRTGMEISGLNDVSGEALLFHAGTRRLDGRTVTSGGRVLNVVGRGDSLESAIRNAYREAAKIHFDGVYFREDIGRRRWNL